MKTKLIAATLLFASVSLFGAVAGGGGVPPTTPPTTPPVTPKKQCDHKKPSTQKDSSKKCDDKRPFRK